MSERRVSWSLLVVALLCLVPVVGGIVLLTYDGGARPGLALIGFFGAGVVVLGRKAITGGEPSPRSSRVRPPCSTRPPESRLTGTRATTKTRRNGSTTPYSCSG